MSVLVTGGAGYIGAHVVRLLQGAADQVVVIDDLSSGRADRVGGAPLVEIDLAAADAVDATAAVLHEHEVTSVIHLAARKRVDESIERPAWYYQQNIGSLATVLLAMEAAGTRQLVFSSSAAVYGETTTSPVDEQAALEPKNPYGRSKLVGEWMVRDACRAWGLRAASLRYFNVAGAAWPELGDPLAVNLVQILLDRTWSGLPAAVFGSDYATSDGTCVRDFVHVVDLAEAHIHVVQALEAGVIDHGELNVGTGAGSTVLQVVQTLAEVLGRELEVDFRPRREGDPSEVVARVDLIAERTGWRSRADLKAIVTSAVAAWEHVHGPLPS